MRQANCKTQGADPDLNMDKWHQRSQIERRADQDKRTRNSNTYFINGGKERRSGKERRHTEERRDRWMRIGKWRSESVFDE